MYRKHCNRVVLLAGLLTVSPSSAIAQVGNLSYSESADFGMDVRFGRPAMAESGDFDMTLTPVARVWGDSNDLFIGGPSPELRVVQLNGASQEPQPWLSMVIDGKAYHWKVQTADTTPIGTGPLSSYPGTILGIGAQDDQGQVITDQAELRSAFIVTENAASLAGSTFDGQEESIHPYYSAGILSRTDDQSLSYQMEQSLVSDSTGSAGEWLEFSNALGGLDDRATRREAWKHLAMEVALQNVVFARTDAGQNGADGQKQALYAYQEAVMRSAGQAATKYKVAEKLQKFANLGIQNLQVTEIVTDFESVADDLGALQLQITPMKQVDLRRTAQLHSAFKALGDAFKVAGTIQQYKGEIAEVLMLQAIARAQGEERLLVLKELADAGAFADSAAAEGINDAVAAYPAIRDSFYEAWAYLRSSNSPLDTVAEITSLIGTGMATGQLTLGLGSAVAPQVASKLSFLASHGAKVFGTTLGAAASGISIAVNINNTVKTLRQADVALTMERAIKQYLLAHHTLGSSIRSDDVASLLSLDQMRYYLQYWHFEKCLNVFKAELYDFYKIVLLDPVGGLMWFRQACPHVLEIICHGWSYDRALAWYETERATAIDKALRAMDARGRVGAKLWNNLDTLLDHSVQEGQYEELTAVDLSAGAERWIYFEAANHGVASDAAYLSVSTPAGIEVLQATVDGLAGAWQTYPIGSGPVWQRGDVGSPSLQQVTDTLYEYQGPFPGGAVHRPGLLIRATADGVYWIKARLAMLPIGANPVDQSVYARSPLSGSIDQQGWESLQVDAVSGVAPCPVLTVLSPLGPVSTVVGQVTQIQFAVSNDCAPSVESYVDLSHDAGLDIESVSPFQSWEYYEPGDLIWHADGQQHPSQKVLFSQQTGHMGGPETRIYTFRVRSSEVGSHSLYIRSSLRGVSMATGTFVRSPDAGASDQQGWPVIPITFQIGPNAPPQCTSATPPEQSLIQLKAGTMTFALAATDPDGLPEPLSYLWTLDGSDRLGTDSSVVVDLSSLPLGPHTLTANVSDGLASCRRDWALTIVTSSDLGAAMTSDVNSQLANLSTGDTARRVTFEVNVTGPAGNTSFSYRWSAPIHPVTGRCLALVAGGGLGDDSAVYATPVMPPESTVPYQVMCVVTGEQTGASGLAVKNIVVTPATLCAADFDEDGDVDGTDLTAFESCASGPAVPFTTGCSEKDLDSDNDVDQSDFGIFQRCYSGEGNPADPHCAQ